MSDEAKGSESESDGLPSEEEESESPARKPALSEPPAAEKPSDASKPTTPREKFKTLSQNVSPRPEAAQAAVPLLARTDPVVAHAALTADEHAAVAMTPRQRKAAREARMAASAQRRTTAARSRPGEHG